MTLWIQTQPVESTAAMPQDHLQDIDAKIDQVMREVSDLLDHILAVLEKDEASRPPGARDGP